jgi:hypothetical protein
MILHKLHIPGFQVPKLLKTDFYISFWGCGLRYDIKNQVFVYTIGTQDLECLVNELIRCVAAARYSLRLPVLPLGTHNFLLVIQMIPALYKVISYDVLSLLVAPIVMHRCLEVHLSHPHFIQDSINGASVC